MAKIVTLKSSNDEDIYPVTDASGIRVTGNVTLQQALDGFVYADDPTAPAQPAPWVASSDIRWATITLGGTWTTTQSISSTGGYIQKSIDISSLGFSSADDYTVILTNRGGGANGWAVTLMVSDKTATGFKITQWNSHWSSGKIGSGNVIDWAVFRLN